MKSNFHALRFLIPFVVFLTTFATAEAIPFRLLGWDNQDDNLVLQLSPTPLELHVPKADFSEHYDTRGAKQLVLYKTVEVDGQPRKQIACTTTVPPDLQRGILVLVPGRPVAGMSNNIVPNKQGYVDRSAPLVYDALWLDDSPQAHPKRTILVRNFSTQPIAVQIESKQITLAPHETSLVPITEGVKRLPVQAAAQVDKTWRVFASRPLRVNTIDRIMLIFKNTSQPEQVNNGGLPVSMIALFDWAPPTPEPNAPETTPQKVTRR